MPASPRTDDWESSSILCFHLGFTYLGVSDRPVELVGQADFYVRSTDGVPDVVATEP